MTTGWKQIIDSAGDATIGAALVRLAQQAAAVHLHETAKLTPAPGTDHKDTTAGGTGRVAVDFAPRLPMEARR